MATPRMHRSLLAAPWLLLLSAPPASAQRIQGIIRDEMTGSPVAEIVVDLLDEEDRIVGQDVTDVNGWFQFDVAEGETHQLRSGGLGYETTLSTAFTLTAGQTVGAEIHMTANPVTLDPLETIVEGRFTALDRAGFYERESMGFNQVRTPEYLKENPPLDIGDLFRGINGIRMIRPTALSDWEILSAREPWGTVCRPSISVDRIVVQRGERWRPVQDRERTALDVAVGDFRLRASHWQDLVTVREIAAMEVFPGQGGLPAWVAGDVSPCGAILFWTRGYIERPRERTLRQ